MDPTIKQKWLDALRSGRYKQGKLVLRSAENRFCCMGVLCDVINEAGWDESGVIRTGRYVYVGPHGNKCSSFIPPDVAEAAQLDTTYEPGLTIKNDRGESFDQIADYIERAL
jgi:hypothetical protein